MSEEMTGLGERTRESIMRAAYPLFLQQGFHGTSMRQIAQKAGVALGGLYYHYPSKEAVFKTVFFEYHPYHEILPALHQVEENTIEALVSSFAYRLVEELKHRPDFLNLMFIEIVEFNSVHVRELFTEIMPMGMEIAARMAKAGGGRLRPLSQPMLIRSFLGLFFSYYITEILISSIAPPEFSQSGIENFVDIYLHGILKPE
jgi:AcrR family transcriptional regulator